jgi:head-tail adaptor
VKFADGWGDIIERPGSDRFEADQRTARQLLTLEVRFVYGLTPRMLVRVNAAMFEIENVAEVQRNRRLLLTCYSHEVEIPPTAQAAQG